MITKVDAYTSVPNAPVLSLSDSVYAGADFIQVKNIDGLDPVVATVNSSSYGAVDGVAYTGSEVLSRNIVLTLNPNPDWNIWSHEQLRDLIYLYFTPKRLVNLVFYSDEVGTVQISGIVESVSANMFIKDPEFIVSIICPDPHFTSIEDDEVSGTTGGSPITINNSGTIDTGIYLKVSHNTGDPSFIRVELGDPYTSYFHVLATVSADRYFDMNSRPRHKFVREVSLTTATVTSRLSGIQDGSEWPFLKSGENKFKVVTDVGSQDFQLKFFKRFSGI